MILLHSICYIYAGVVGAGGERPPNIFFSNDETKFDSHSHPPRERHFRVVADSRIELIVVLPSGFIAWTYTLDSHDASKYFAG